MSGRETKHLFVHSLPAADIRSQGNKSLAFYSVDAIIRCSDILMEICAGLLARYRDCLPAKHECFGETDYTRGSLRVWSSLLVSLEVELEITHRTNNVY